MAGASDPAPALKEIFDAARFRAVARTLSELDGKFDAARFLTLSLDGLEPLSLMQRLRRMTESLHATLPPDYRKSITLLKRLAPRIDKAFVTLVLPDFAGLYGQAHFGLSMDALKFFTSFGSSEFAIREFLKRDLSRTLAVMEEWSHDPSEHVRRLASEGCRPRLPWSFQLPELIAEPAPVLPILENLKSDSSLYVRKSVANHLNDHTKAHPGWVMDRLSGWPLENPHTAWIAKHALRTLVKKGDSRALSLIGAGGAPEVRVTALTASPSSLRLGDRLSLTLSLASLPATPQRLVIDYAVHYIKKSGTASAKVFKWKELTLASGETLTLTRSQVIRDFTTRTHHPGRHLVTVLANGIVLGETFFDLLP